VRLAERIPVRVKDMPAWQLSHIRGFPAFQPDWRVSHKDRAAADVAEFLRLYETQLRAFPMKPQGMACNEERVFLGR
jgi:hypothetical protein